MTSNEVQKLHPGQGCYTFFLNAQGRILVPQYLKEHAGLRFDVLVQGAGNRAEIWDAKRWAAYEKSTIAPAFKKIGKSVEI